MFLYIFATNSEQKYPTYSDFFGFYDFYDVSEFTDGIFVNEG